MLDKTAGGCLATPRCLNGFVALSLFCDYFLLTVVIPILPLVLASPDVTTVSEQNADTLLFIVFGAKPLAQILCNPLMGWLVDKRGPRLVLLVSFAALFTATVVFTLPLSGSALPFTYWPRYALLFAARLVQGCASSGVMTGGMYLVTNNCAPGTEGEASSQVMMWFGLEQRGLRGCLG